MKLFLTEQLGNGTSTLNSGADTSSPVMNVPLNPAMLGKPIHGHYVITQVFGHSSVRGIHKGVDFGVPVGTPIYPIADGVVLKSGNKPGKSNGGYSHEGNYVVINHSDGTTSYYYHMSKLLVSVGDKVTQSTMIGLSGNTGNSTGPHLHLEVHREQEVIPISF